MSYLIASAERIDRTDVKVESVITETVTVYTYKYSLTRSTNLK